jgi:hypothetical protein
MTLGSYLQRSNELEHRFDKGIGRIQIARMSTGQFDNTGASHLLESLGSFLSGPVFVTVNGHDRKSGIPQGGKSFRGSRGDTGTCDRNPTLSVF